MILTFNGKNFIDFNCWWDGSQVYRTPSKSVEFFSIEGRNGDLSISHDRFSNVTIPFNCFIKEDFRQNYSALINYLSSVEGYARLETTEEPDIYRMGQFVDSVEPSTTQFNEGGLFTLNFNCKPQKWLKSGENELSMTSGDVLFNPTYFDAKPLLMVTGTGTITINDTVLTLSTNTSTTYIDCDIQDAYEGTTNRNGNLTITNGFPVLASGENTIAFTTDTLTIVPRWWQL